MNCNLFFLIYIYIYKEKQVTIHSNKCLNSADLKVLSVLQCLMC